MNAWFTLVLRECSHFWCLIPMCIIIIIRLLAGFGPTNGFVLMRWNEQKTIHRSKNNYLYLKFRQMLYYCITMWEVITIWEGTRPDRLWVLDWMCVPKSACEYYSTTGYYICAIRVYCKVYVLSEQVETTRVRDQRSALLYAWASPRTTKYVLPVLLRNKIPSCRFRLPCSCWWVMLAISSLLASAALEKDIKAL